MLLPSPFYASTLMAAPRGMADGRSFGCQGDFSAPWGSQVTYSKERIIGHSSVSDRSGFSGTRRVPPLSSIIDSSRSSTNLRRIGDVPFPPSTTPRSTLLSLRFHSPLLIFERNQSSGSGAALVQYTLCNYLLAPLTFPIRPAQR